MSEVLGTDGAALGDWLNARLPHAIVFPPDAPGLAVVRDGQVIAGWLYAQGPGSLWDLACAAEPASRWCSRAVLAAMFGYAWTVLGASALLTAVAESNRRSLGQLERLGFVRDATRPGYWPDGQAAILLSMMPAACRWTGAGR